MSGRKLKMVVDVCVHAVMVYAVAHCLRLAQSDIWSQHTALNSLTGEQKL